MIIIPLKIRELQGYKLENNFVSEKARLQSFCNLFWDLSSVTNLCNHGYTFFLRFVTYQLTDYQGIEYQKLHGYKVAGF